MLMADSHFAQRLRIAVAGKSRCVNDAFKVVNVGYMINGRHRAGILLTFFYPR